MRIGGPLWCGLLAFAVMGCHAPVRILRPGTPAPTFAQPATLSMAAPSRIEPEYAKLPPALTSVQRESFAYRGLDEATAQRYAVLNAAIANVLDGENARASMLGSITRRGTVNAAADDLMRTVRQHAAMDARNRAAAEALERYLQLADAEGRDELLAMGLAVFTALRKEGPKLRDARLLFIFDDELERQQIKLLADRESVEASLGLLNHDLDGKLGTKLARGERFWPAVDLGVWNEPIDVEAAVLFALQNRADLQLLRSLRDRVNADNLPTVQQALQQFTTLTVTMSLPGKTLMTKITERCMKAAADPLQQSEASSRRLQIQDLLTQQEAVASAQVRTAATQLASAAKRVGLLRSRSESLGAKLATAKRENRLADVLTLESDHLKARADVLAAVIEWHQWRVKLKAAQGLLATECLTSEPVRTEGPGPGTIPLKVKHR